MSAENQIEKKAEAIHDTLSAKADYAYSLLTSFQRKLAAYQKDLDNRSLNLEVTRKAMELEEYCKENPEIRSDVTKIKEKMEKLIQQERNAPKKGLDSQKVEEVQRKIAAAEAEAAKKPAFSGFLTVVGVLCAIAALVCFVVNKIIEPSVMVAMVGTYSIFGVVGSFVVKYLLSSPMRKASERATALKAELAKKERDANRQEEKSIQAVQEYCTRYGYLLRILNGTRVIDLDM